MALAADFESTGGPIRWGSTLWDADYGADLEVGGVGEYVVAIDHAPFVSTWRRGEMILVVIRLFAAVPVFVLDGSAFSPFLVLDIGVVVVAVLVMVLGKGNTAHKSCGEDC